MLFKEYKKMRLGQPEYDNLLKTLQDLYDDELDEVVVYPKDIPNKEYEDGRLLLLFGGECLVIVIFTDSTVYVKPTKYEEVKYSFFREESLNPSRSQPGALILNVDNEEITLSPVEDFSSHTTTNRWDLTATIYKLLTMK